MHWPPAVARRAGAIAGQLCRSIGGSAHQLLGDVFGGAAVGVGRLYQPQVQLETTGYQQLAQVPGHCSGERGGGYKALSTGGERGYKPQSTGGERDINHCPLVKGEGV